jgi:hypothetical protein
MRNKKDRWFTYFFAFCLALAVTITIVFFVIIFHFLAKVW